MPNNLTPADVVIVPREATDAMQIAVCLDFMNGAPKEFSAQSSYQFALQYAPPHNLIAVDKGEWDRLQNIAREYNYTIKACNIIGVDWKNIRSQIANLKLAALEQKQ